METLKAVDQVKQNIEDTIDNIGQQKIDIEDLKENNEQLYKALAKKVDKNKLARGRIDASDLSPELLLDLYKDGHIALSSDEAKALQELAKGSLSNNPLGK